MVLRIRVRVAMAVSLAAALAFVVVGSAVAANISGTPKNDVLRGTAGADRISGAGGNDKLYGLAGTDVLNGGAGNDVLIGGPGADKLACGPGRDVAVVDVKDTFGADCETVSGLPKPDVVVADVSGDEGNSGMRTMEFPVELAKAAPLEATVAFATQNGTATAGPDFVATSGTLVFKPGETRKIVAVSVVGDSVVEENETFTVALSKPVNATLRRASATGTITNEDVPKPKAGRYTGTTSQGRAVSFDVNPELTAVSKLVIYLDVSCPSVGVTLPNEPIEFPSLPLGADWTFGITDSYSDADGSGSLRLAGALAIAGPATGSIRVDLLLNTPIGAISCSTGDVTWSVPPPA